MSTQPITRNRMFEEVTPAEWTRVQSKLMEHLDVMQAITYLRAEAAGTSVRIKCFTNLLHRKRMAACQAANRRHMRIATKYNDGWLYIRKEE